MRSRSSSATTASGSQMSQSFLTNEEIGISESSGALGLSRNEELQLGIESIKQQIIESENQPERKALLIEKLIELRSELQELNGDIVTGEKGSQYTNIRIDLN